MNDEKLKKVDFGPRVHDLQQDLLKVLRDYHDLPEDAVLATICQLVGMMLTGLDTAKMSPDVIMQMVMKNIEQGNLHALQALHAQGGTGTMQVQ